MTKIDEISQTLGRIEEQNVTQSEHLSKIESWLKELNGSVAQNTVFRKVTSKIYAGFVAILTIVLIALQVIK